MKDLMDTELSVAIHLVVRFHEKYCRDIPEERCPTLHEILDLLCFWQNPFANEADVKKTFKLLWGCPSELVKKIDLVKQEVMREISEIKETSILEPPDSAFETPIKTPEVTLETSEIEQTQETKETNKATELATGKYLPQRTQERGSGGYLLEPPKVLSEKKLGRAWKQIRRCHKRKSTTELDILKMLETCSVSNIWKAEYITRCISRISVLVLRDVSFTMAPYNRQIDEILQSLEYYSHFQIYKREFFPYSKIEYNEWKNLIKEKTLTIDRHLTLLITDGVSLGWMSSNAKVFFEAISPITELIWLNPYPDWLYEATILGCSIEPLKGQQDTFVFGVISCDDQGILEIGNLPGGLYTRFVYQLLDKSVQDTVKNRFQQNQTDIKELVSDFDLTHEQESFDLVCLASLLDVFDADLLHLLRRYFVQEAKYYHEAELYSSGLVIQKDRIFQIKPEVARFLYEHDRFKKLFPPPKILEVYEYISEYIIKRQIQRERVWETQFTLCNNIVYREPIHYDRLSDSPVVELFTKMGLIPLPIEAAEVEEVEFAPLPIEAAKVANLNAARVESPRKIADQIVIRLGNMFDEPCDLIVIPCSTTGTISDFIRGNLEKYNIPPPESTTSLGENFFLSLEKNDIARFVCYASSVDNYSSSLSAIKLIGEKIGELTIEEESIKKISSSLLGTGAGGLDNIEAAENLIAGFLSTSSENSTLILNILDIEVFNTVVESLEKKKDEFQYIKSKKTIENWWHYSLLNQAWEALASELQEAFVLAFNIAQASENQKNIIKTRHLIEAFPQVSPTIKAIYDKLPSEVLPKPKQISANLGKKDLLKSKPALSYCVDVCLRNLWKKLNLNQQISTLDLFDELLLEGSGDTINRFRAKSVTPDKVKEIIAEISKVVLIHIHPDFATELNQLLREWNNIQNKIKFIELYLEPKWEAIFLTKGRIPDNKASNTAAKIRKKHGYTKTAGIIIFTEKTLYDEIYSQLLVGGIVEEQIGVISLAFLRELYKNDKSLIFLAIVANILHSLGVDAGLEAHEDTRGCVMDFCSNMEDIKVGLQNGIHFCDECSLKLNRTQYPFLTKLADFISSPEHEVSIPALDFIWSHTKIYLCNSIDEIKKTDWLKLLVNDLEERLSKLPIEKYHWLDLLKKGSEILFTVKKIINKSKGIPSQQQITAMIKDPVEIQISLIDGNRMFIFHDWPTCLGDYARCVASDATDIIDLVFQYPNGAITWFDRRSNEQTRDITSDYLRLNTAFFCSLGNNWKIFVEMHQEITDKKGSSHLMNASSIASSLQKFDDMLINLGSFVLQSKYNQDWTRERLSVGVAQWILRIFSEQTNILEPRFTQGTYIKVVESIKEIKNIRNILASPQAEPNIALIQRLQYLINWSLPIICDALIAILIDILKVEKDTREELIQTLTKLGEPAILKMLEVLNNSDSQIRECVAKALVIIGPQYSSLLSPLIENLKNSDSYVKSSIAWVLGHMGSQAEMAIPSLISLLKDENPEVREASVKAIGNIGDKSGLAVPALLELLHEENNLLVGEAIIKTLTTLGRKGQLDVPTLVIWLDSQNVRVAEAAARILGEIATLGDSVISGLIKTLQNQNWAIRLSAAEALGNICLRVKNRNSLVMKAYSSLSYLLKDKNGYVRESSRNAIAKIKAIPWFGETHTILRTPQKMAELAVACTNNHLSKEQVNFCLRKININPGEITSSDDLVTYYFNVIQYLVPQNKLENWLIELTKEGFLFAQEWLTQLENLSIENYMWDLVVFLTQKDSLPNNADPADVLIICGNDNLETFQEAANLYGQRLIKYIFATGGQGRLTIPLIKTIVKTYGFVSISEHETITTENIQQIIPQLDLLYQENRLTERVHVSESEIIKQVLITLGVPKEVILTESKSRYTLENFLYAKETLKEKNIEYKAVIFIQTPLQQFRTKATFNKAFEEEIKKGLKGISWTIDYNIRGIDQQLLAKVLIEEIWRLIIYTASGNLIPDIEKGLDVIPDEIWASTKGLVQHYKDITNLNETLISLAKAIGFQTPQNILGNLRTNQVTWDKVKEIAVDIYAQNLIECEEVVIEPGMEISVRLKNKSIGVHINPQRLDFKIHRVEITPLEDMWINFKDLTTTSWANDLFPAFILNALELEPPFYIKYSGNSFSMPIINIRSQSSRKVSLSIRFWGKYESRPDDYELPTLLVAEIGKMGKWSREIPYFGNNIEVTHAICQAQDKFDFEIRCPARSTNFKVKSTNKMVNFSLTLGNLAGDEVEIFTTPAMEAICILTLSSLRRYVINIHLHPEFSEEIQKIIKLWNEVQSRLKFVPFRLNKEQAKLLEINKLSSEDAERLADKIRESFEIHKMCGIILFYEGWLYSADTFQLFSWTNRNVNTTLDKAIISLRKMRELQTPTSPVFLMMIKCLLHTLGFSFGLEEHKDTQKCIMDYNSDMSKILLTLDQGPKFCSLCTQILETSPENGEHLLALANVSREELNKIQDQLSEVEKHKMKRIVEGWKVEFDSVLDTLTNTKNMSQIYFILGFDVFQGQIMTDEKLRVEGRNTIKMTGGFATSASISSGGLNVFLSRNFLKIVNRAVVLTDKGKAFAEYLRNLGYIVDRFNGQVFTEDIKHAESLFSEVMRLVDKVPIRVREKVFKRVEEKSGKITVKELYPKFKRESKEHEILRLLRTAQFVEPSEGGQWESFKHIEITPFGKILLKFQKGRGVKEARALFNEMKNLIDKVPVEVRKKVLKRVEEKSGKITVKELYPEFKRESEEHEILRLLRTTQFIEPSEGEQWESHKHIKIKPFGKILLKFLRDYIYAKQ